MTEPIETITAFEALDSRGRPTVGCNVVTRGGARGRAIVPSGASTGSHEARELRDGGERYGGYGVLRAVANAEGELLDAVRGIDVTDQSAVDRALREADGTPDGGRLGANAILAISVAAAQAAAATRGLPLYAAVGDGPRTPSDADDQHHLRRRARRPRARRAGLPRRPRRRLDVRRSDRDRLPRARRNRRSAARPRRDVGARR